MRDRRRISQIQTKEVEIQRENGLAALQAVGNSIREMAASVHESVQFLGDLDLNGVVCARKLIQTDHLRQCDNRLAAQANDVLQRLLNRVVQTHHDRQRDEVGQTAAHRADAVLLIQLLHLLVELDTVVRVLLLQLLELGVHRAHGEHTLLALDGQRDADQLYQQREQDNGDTVVLHDAVQPLQQQAERSNDQNTEQFRIFDQVRKLIQGHKNLHVKL